MDKLSLVRYEKVSLSNELTDKEIRNLVKTETQLPVRRLDTFTLISLLTVHRLFNQVHSHTSNDLVASNTPGYATELSDSQCKAENKLSLYSAAEYLSVDLFQSVLNDIHNNESIRPFDFIATVGNAANFYIAKEFNIKGPNIFIGASEKPFLKSCALAEVDLLEGFSEQGVIVVWHLTKSYRQCYAFIVEAHNSKNTPLANTKILEMSDTNLDIDILIKQDSDIPVPSLIQSLF
jgi:hypothetical protein